MIVPIIVGFVIGRFVSKNNHVNILSLIAAVVMGLLAGFEIAPVIYPLMIIQIPWVGIPEIRRVALVFGVPDLILFSESVHFQSYSIILLGVAFVVSFVGVILGVYLGKRFRRSSIDSPWEPKNEDE